MLKYWETNWKSEKGFETHTYQVIFNEVLSQGTVIEQKKRPERLSLVMFLEEKQSNYLIDICRLFHKNFEHFYFDNNKKFHTTLLGFPVMEAESYDAITERINQFSLGKQLEMNVRFDLIRLGTKYKNTNTLNPINRVSNGTVIAFGYIEDNDVFTNFGNALATFLIKDKKLRAILGENFRRRFPTVWCTMGYYTTDFEINNKLEILYSKFQKLDSHYFDIPCYQLELGTSHYKDLRDWKRIQKFSLQTN